MTDPISDMLIRLQNASRVGHTAVTLPYSAMKQSIAKVLEKEGYVADAKKKDNTLTMSLLYKNSRPVINGVKRISKPSRRMYVGVRDIHQVKRGAGLLVISTPEGVLAGKEARAKRVGGEPLFEIW